MDLGIVLKSAMSSCPRPHTIVMHIGGNDITSDSILSIKRNLHDAYNYIQATHPDTRVIFSEIVGRNVYPGAGSWRAADRKRRRINSLLRSLVGSANVIPHPDLDGTDGLLRSDGVHLTDVGNIFLIRDILVALT